MQSDLLDEQTSLLNQILDEIQKMDVEEKKKLLIKLRKEEILAKVSSLDAVAGSPKAKVMTDDEADNYVSHQRKIRYEQSQT